MIFAGQLYCIDIHTCCALLPQEDAEYCSLCLALSLMEKRMPLGFLAGADRPSLWPQLPLHSERVPLLTWLTARINCHRALCDPGMQLPTDPNHLLGRKSLSLTPCCQHLPVDTSLSLSLLFFVSPSSCVTQLISGKGCSHQKQLQSNMSVRGICESYTVVLKQQAMGLHVLQWFYYYHVNNP